ncbi:6-phospho-3-hexuloisomerase [Anaerobacillus isosaccharinicus]|uniref:6-phospho-3-hexuloisomerase n=1 Tax=Anaerobacillus isosaccharinicus TaxID=1532552 RepID=A0A1S2LHJ1_9BACI|nr:6-phospho-3-hexuloisomerase [Anaerobacillus isosaccharinicus]MBA5588353.1 6-phospho-3-hexuloisomerase [Anaerobacillus isosaccharinicus]QOY38213.1 6-phospho-3-hexuloisomerase [Anaerobacillus isosaccharinicus]
MKNAIKAVVNEVSTVLSNVNIHEALSLSIHLSKAKRIFICGEGRSGLMGKVFAMRLMHGGFHVYVIGETITPSIKSGDLLITISGSGSTGSLLQFAKKAKEVGAKNFLVTTNRDSKISQICDGVLVIPAATKFRLSNEPETIQPLGNQFDQSVHLLLDAILIFTLSNSGNTNEMMTRRHANLE